MPVEVSVRRRTNSPAMSNLLLSENAADGFLSVSGIGLPPRTLSKANPVADRSIRCILALVLAVSVLRAQEPPQSPADWGATVARVRSEAAIVFSKTYQVDCPPAVVEKALDHPALMGALWDIYGYAPAYEVKGLDSGAVHVDDPTGIVGEVRPVKREGPRRTYLARGQLDHWAVPALNGGTAVFEVETAGNGAGTTLTVDVFIQPESGVAGALLAVLEPLVLSHVDNRVSLNLEDAAKIMRAIDQEPEAVFGRIEEAELQNAFRRVF